MNKIICKLFGHRPVLGDWVYVCDRCGKALPNKLPPSAIQQLWERDRCQP